MTNDEGLRTIGYQDTDICIVLPPNRVTWYAFDLGKITKKYRHRTLMAKLNEQSLQADHERVVFVTDGKNTIVWCAVVDKHWLQQTIRELQTKCSPYYPSIAKVSCNIIPWLRASSSVLYRHTAAYGPKYAAKQ